MNTLHDTLQAAVALLREAARLSSHHPLNGLLHDQRAVLRLLDEARACITALYEDQRTGTRALLREEPGHGPACDPDRRLLLAALDDLIDLLGAGLEERESPAEHAEHRYDGLLAGYANLGTETIHATDADHDPDIPDHAHWPAEEPHPEDGAWWVITTDEPRDRLYLSLWDNEADAHWHSDRHPYDTAVIPWTRDDPEPKRR